MSDELDPLLLRRFAQRSQPLEGADFVTGVTAHLPDGRAAHAARVLITVVRGLGASTALLRSGYGRLLLLGATAVTLWASFV